MARCFTFLTKFSRRCFPQPLCFNSFLLLSFVDLSSGASTPPKMSKIKPKHHARTSTARPCPIFKPTSMCQYERSCQNLLASIPP